MKLQSVVDDQTGRASSPLSRRSFLRVTAAATTLVVLGACAGDDPSPVPGESDGRPNSDGGRRSVGSAAAPVTAFTIVADNLEWDLDRIVVPAGQEVTATIDNRDEGVDHNFHLRSSGDPKTELEAGTVIQTLTFTVAEPGEYEYLCDIHPFMKGTLEAV